MYTQDDLLPISGLQHLVFCERQCALIHVEMLWKENRLTAEGRIVHERVHSKDQEARKNIRFRFSLPLRSLRLGLIGQAALVEFHLSDPSHVKRAGPFPEPTYQINRRPGKKNSGKIWRPFPVEYKRGRPKSHQADRIQLCAQALCLEEMLETEVPRGMLYYGKTRRREEVVFDNVLRQETEEAARRFHELVVSGKTPKASYTKKCDACSLIDLCLPKALSGGRSIKRYLLNTLRDQ